MTTTTQSPRLARGTREIGPSGARDGSAPQTRLPWWALALPALAFAALLTLLTSGSASADGSGSGSGSDVLGRLAALIGTLVHHVL